MCDTTQSVAANRAKLYVNGVEPELQTADYPDLNEDGAGFYFNSTRRQVIAHEDERWRYEFPGYLSEFYMIDGTNLTASDFGELNSNNKWVPLDNADVKDAVTFGTNGFFLKFQDSSALGDDTSGNGNDYAATNVAASDQMLDVPTNNFCVLNPLPGAGDSQVTWNEGNLMSTSASGTSNYNQMLGSFEVSSGKWYWEGVWTVEVSGNDFRFFGGIIPSANIKTPGEGWSESGVICYYWGLWAGTSQNGYKNINATKTTYGATGGDGDIMGIALNCDDDEITFYKNNVSQGAISFHATTTTPLLPYMPTLFENASGMSRLNVNFGADSSFAGTKTAQNNQDDNDQGDFYYEPPAGFLALCEDNLSAPEIALPGENFNTVLYSGNSTADRAVTGVGFAEDFAWIKTRTGGVENHTWCDVVRGTGNHLRSDSTAAQIDSLGVTSFDSDGFTLPNHNQVNGSGYTYVAWNWKAGGTPTADNSAGAGATPTAGSVKIDGANLGSALAGTIPATRLSANTTAGFSIIEYTGDGNGDATFAHGLSTSPDMVIIKNLDDTKGWMVWTPDLGSSGGDCTYLLSLEGTGGVANWCEDTIRLNGTTKVQIASSSGGSTFGWVNQTGVDYISYCWNSIEGYSKVGSYTGNADADGPFIYTGFKPAFTIVKLYSHASYGWVMMDDARDTYNVMAANLRANTSAAETDGSEMTVDYTSNGFKIRNTNNAANGSSYSYIYLAFAESPFKTSNAR